jgi:leucyl aminopeptidase
MLINVKFSKLKKENFENYVIFSKENFQIDSLEKFPIDLSKKDLNTLTNAAKNNEKDFLNFNINPNQKITLIKLKRNISFLEIEKLGANFFDFINLNSFLDLVFLGLNIKKSFQNNSFFLNHFLHGIKLKSYEFNKYKTKKISKKFNITILENGSSLFNESKKSEALLRGVKLTKDLVSEPGNVLHPDEYARRISQLKKIGLKVNIYDKKKLKKLGMNALLGVGQGSIRGSYLVTIEWNGSNKKDKPLAFVGKGVCFDTGGISLKPAKFMEDMTYDMAGSAVVVGLMKNLALRKAKINAIGVVGLVENMPDGNAQRPGDIVKSYSGKTIEILNTDAEGRLVLADALTFTEKKFKPKLIVDLATLTGAIIVSLGSEYAGLFSNDDKLSNQIFNAGEKVGEKVWRMPLNENYDKLINSKKADMQNINYVGGAGSTTAAQFLQRFIINNTPWAHLDIAGMAFSKYGGALNSGGATGFGVRLLNQLIEDNYE